MRIGLNVLCVAFVVLLGSHAWGHGVEGEIAPSEGYMATARYDDGEPMSYSETEIRSPDSELPFQTGRTDRNGRVFFKPDRPGKWQVIVKDGMGHRLALELAVGESDGAEKAETVEPVARTGGGAASSRTMGVVAGLSLIFGLSGVAFGWKNRRSGVGDRAKP